MLSAVFSISTFDNRVLASSNAPLGTNLSNPPPSVSRNRKIDSALASLYDVPNAEAFAKEHSLYYSGGRTKVVLELDSEDPSSKIDRLKSLGAIIECRYKNKIQAAIPVSKLVDYANLEFVRSIQPPATPTESVVSQGVNTIRANLVQSEGILGTGVKVAVIDIGFDVSNPEISSRITETKSFLTPPDITGGGNTQHGTSCTEIIIDVAPNANLYLYNINSNIEFLNAMQYAINQHVNIISASICWAYGPFDGTSDISSMVNTARSNGILVVAPAGNAAQQHWEGSFLDTDYDNWHNFQGIYETNPIYLSSGEVASIYLSWHDWPYSSQDYDLCLFDATLEMVAFSVNDQSGTQPPKERIIYTAPVSGYYFIAIWKHSATQSVYFELYTYNQDLLYYVPSSSMMMPGDSPGALVVGATHYETDEIKSYSSNGPTDDGRMKPDVTGPTDVSTSGYSTFGGTSASTPHVAGAAALLLHANAALTVDALQSLLESHAVDRGSPGRDNVYGSGRIDVYESYAHARIFTLDSKTDPTGTSSTSGTYLLAAKVSQTSSSGPTGDQSSTSTTFTPTVESLSVTLGSGDKLLLIGTSQLWNDNPAIGSSICISRTGTGRISGDMYAVGASLTHRHLATAIAVDSTVGSHTYTLDFKTDQNGKAWASGTYLLAVKISDSWSSGPTGDQSSTSTSFVPTMENLDLNYAVGDKFLILGTSQCWNSNPAIGSSICISRGRVRISGDMFAVGANINHRHLATAIAVWTAP